MPTASLPPRLLLLAALLSLTCQGLAQDPSAPEEGEENGKGVVTEEAAGKKVKAPPKAARGPQLPGFVHVPAGLVLPGCTYKNYQARHRENDKLKRALIYEVWGNQPPFKLPAFHLGRYEVTNAQWKLYLDRKFREPVETTGTETLKSLAERFVKFRGVGVTSEWKAIYALNAKAIVKAWKSDERKDKEGKVVKKATWNPAWTIADPPAEPGNDISELPLPKGLKLVLYRHRVPQSWYGWCKLANLRVGREYCDITKPFNEAFLVPTEDPLFKDLKFRDTDFAAYAVRSVSPDEMLAFAEWAGCELPTEYEFERAGRGDNLKWQHTFGPKWDHGKQKNLFPWADSDKFRTNKGPFRVDDQRAAGSDSPYGARMMLGNVWELTRTFFDLHPDVKPEPPAPDSGVTNYALTAKGGSWGDPWQLEQLSVRTGVVGGILTLRYQNRADSLGLRLARHHERPGFDLLLHSILRLAYDPGATTWNRYVPHAFALQRMDGADEVHFAAGGEPYAIVQDQAHGVAFAPLWITDMSAAGVSEDLRSWRQGKAERRTHWVLGVLRSDVPLRGGVRLTDKAARDLVEKRKKWKKMEKEWKKLPTKKRRQVKLPPEPAGPDEYEKATAKNAKECGRWREGTIPPGEWLVVYWHGFIGLANKTLTMPPDAIFMVGDPKKQFVRRRFKPSPATLELKPNENAIRLVFATSERAPQKRKRREPPREEESQWWALYEVLPQIWLGGEKGARDRPYSWFVDVTLSTEEGALKPYHWRRKEGN